MPIFCVKSVKIYTVQKKFTRTYSWGSWQIWGMTVGRAYLCPVGSIQPLSSFVLMLLKFFYLWWSVVIFLSFMEWCPSGPLIIHNLVQTRRSKGIETNSSKSKICWKWKNNKLKTNSSKSKIKNNQQRNLWGHLWWSESQSYMFPFN